MQYTACSRGPVDASPAVRRPRSARRTIRVLTMMAVGGVLGGCEASPLTPSVEVVRAPTSPAPTNPTVTAGRATEAYFAYSCGASIATDQAAGDAELRASYEQWRQKNVTAAGAGAGGLRVVGGPYFKHVDTPSEGIGYGMILAAYLNDKPTFDGLWSYARSHRNRRGLMPWLMRADGTPGDNTAATDADVDMAFALIAADRRWGGYRADATALITSIRKHLVEPGTSVLKPGDTWGGSQVTNPSYFAFAFFKLFGEYTGDASWAAVTEESYAIVERINARGINAATGLLPDWSTADGSKVTVLSDRGYQYGWDAIRSPWRLATDAAWNCDPRAVRQLGRMNAFFRDKATTLKDGYELNGRAFGGSRDVAFVGPAAAAAVVAADAEHRASYWRETVRLRDVSYYSGALRLLSMLLASGNMPHPAYRLLDSFETGRADRWDVVSGGTSSLTAALGTGGAMESGHALDVSYRVGTGAASLDLGFTPRGQDWSSYQLLELRFRGTGSGNRIRLELRENRNATTGAVERFEYEFADDLAGWKTVRVPLASLRRRAGEAGSRDAAPSLRDVWGISLQPVGGSGRFSLDQVLLAR